MLNADWAAQAQLVLDELFLHGFEVGLFSLGMAVYAIIIWQYYHLVAKRDLFRFKRKEGRGFEVLISNLFGEFVFLLEYLIVFPLITFVFFSVFAVMLFFLAKEQPLESILLISITVIAATRITAYYNEALAQDVAKLIPLVMLGVFILEPNFFSVSLVQSRIEEVPLFLNRIAGFLLFTLALEVALKVVLGVKHAVLGGDEKLGEGATK
ncbi:MAG: hypothetical protein HY393_03395 [Candidatus Diapherotrites archaeon]|nr:hypothetical protein [Candidatus Diapherotrites archaeon]